jgi:hypothetical protein
MIPLPQVDATPVVELSPSSEPTGPVDPVVEDELVVVVDAPSSAVVPSASVVVLVSPSAAESAPFAQPVATILAATNHHD